MWPHFSSFPQLCSAVYLNLSSPYHGLRSSRNEGRIALSHTSQLFGAGGRISTTIALICFWGSHQNEPETRIWVQRVYLGVTPGNTSRERCSETGEGRNLEKGKLGLHHLRSVGCSSESPPWGRKPGYLSTNPHPSLLSVSLGRYCSGLPRVGQACFGGISS